MTRSRYTNEDIIDAYRRTGSVWRAGKELGLTGQTVHERLSAIGYPLAGRAWDEEELEELRALASHCTIGEIARRLGRPYAGVAQKVSRLDLGTRYGNRQQRKLPRGAGYDKASTLRYAREITDSGVPVSRYARAHGLGVEQLCQALERHLPDWWETHRKTHSDLDEIACKGCGQKFIPSNARQQFHSRRCADTYRRDQDYFGGKRSRTVGLAEGRCQLCGREVTRGLSSHHVLGKENDPENELLIALCQGCHKIVTFLGARAFVDDEAAWETLVSLAWLRRHGANPGHGVHIVVDIDELTAEDVEESA